MHKPIKVVSIKFWVGPFLAFALDSRAKVWSANTLRVPIGVNSLAFMQLFSSGEGDACLMSATHGLLYGWWTWWDESKSMSLSVVKDLAMKGNGKSS